MFKAFLKTTFRSLNKNRSNSFLNIFGLAIGITCAALIFLWVEDEMGFDHNNVKRNNLYLVKMNNDVDAGVFTHSSTPIPMARALQAEIPGIKQTAKVDENLTSLLFGIGDKLVYASGHYAEPSIFDMFTLPFLEGNAGSAFSELHAMVITKKAAIKFFGDDKNIMGKTVRVNNNENYVITGVLQDLPENASLQFEWLAPYQVYYQTHQGNDRWTSFGTTTYVELKDGVNVENINKQLYDYIQQKQGSTTSTAHPFLYNMNYWHLYNDFDNGKQTSNGRIQYVHLFTIIAWIILLIACINFMNLSTARSERRAREVGVRKVLGAAKQILILQFIGEALLIAFFSTVIAVIFMFLILPGFNELVQKNLSLALYNPTHIIALFAITLVCGIVAGSYPSLYLSSFNPVVVLKGMKFKSGGAAFIRKGLVVMQFTISIVLIIGTIIIYQQIQHIKNRDIGYNKNNLIQMSVQGNMVQNFQVIKQDLLSTGIVENAALADHQTLSDGNNTTGLDWREKNANSVIVISQRLVSGEFMATTGMKIIEGRDFRPTDEIVFGENHQPKDTTQVFNIIVTESFEKILGKGSAIGKTISEQTDRGTLNMEVVGVAKDYVYGNMYGQSAPVVFYFIPHETNLLYVRTKTGSDPESALSKIASVMKKDNPAFPFTYQFVDDQFNAKFSSEMLVSKLSRVFATLAIIISCLGLFGLATYTAERRTKEIGVRKVLGATVSGIAALLSTEFLKLVALSCLIAFPLAWWMMHSWLQGYQYRVEINWMIFLVAALTAIIIALFTVSFQAIRAAMANPVKSLKDNG